MDNFLLKNFEKDILTLFKKTHIIRGKTNSGTWLVQVQNKPILTFLRSLIRDYRSHYLYIPKFIDKKELQKEFLSAFYDDEGCVSLRIFKKTKEIKRNITLSSNSLILLEEIKKILQENFNIKSNKIIKDTKKVGDREFINYVLSITGKENFVRFKDKINFTHLDKREKLQKMINSYIRK